MRRSIVFIVPGRLATRSGGYGYDRRMIEALRARHWDVEVRELEGGFPAPSRDALNAAGALLDSLPDDATVVVDGLAYGVMPEQAAAVARRLRLIALVHHPLADETGIDPAIALVLQASEREALRHARRVVVTSGATAASVVERFGVEGDRIRVVEPGTDPAPLARGSGGGSVHLLTVANLIPRKRHDLLVRALTALPPALRHSWRLTCVGGVHYDASTVRVLREQIAAAGLDGQVRLVGELEGQPLADAYDEADVFVLATQYEGFGMVVGEALARGLPVISTRTGGIPALVLPDAGTLVEPGDVGALTDALAGVIADAARRARLAEGARAVRTRLATWEQQAAKFADALHA